MNKLHIKCNKSTENEFKSDLASWARAITMTIVRAERIETWLCGVDLRNYSLYGTANASAATSHVTGVYGNTAATLWWHSRDTLMTLQ